MYVRGSLDGAGMTTSGLESGANLRRLGPDQLIIEGAMPGANFSVLSSAGAVLHRGQCDSQGATVLPAQFTQSQVIMVQIQSSVGHELLRLGGVIH